MKYCPECATALEDREAFGRVRPVCPACGFVYFRDPKVAAGVIVQHRGKVLLARRGIEPGKGRWYMPSGFVDWEEEPEEAAVREVREETGLTVAIDGLVGVYPLRDDFGRRGVWICYHGHVVSGELSAGDDAVEVGFFPPDAVPPNLAFEGTREALEDWTEIVARKG